MSEDRAAMFDNFRAKAEKNGMATAPVTDGRIFLFKSDYLRRLLLTDNEPAITVGVRQADGTIKEYRLGHDRLQSELDATTQPFILIFLSDGPVKN